MDHSPQFLLNDGTVININYVKTVEFIYRGKTVRRGLKNEEALNFLERKYELGVGSVVELTFDQDAIVTAGAEEGKYFLIDSVRGSYQQLQKTVQRGSPPATGAEEVSSEELAKAIIARLDGEKGLQIGRAHV